MTERDRTIALYTFLKEFVQLRTKTIPRYLPLRTGRAGHLGRRHSTRNTAAIASLGTATLLMHPAATPRMRSG